MTDIIEDSKKPCKHCQIIRRILTAVILICATAVLLLNHLDA